MAKQLERDSYSSPRWTSEVLDCSMPMTFDTYSNCAHQCVYCFSFFRRAVGSAADAYLAHKVSSVNVDTIKRMFLEPDKYAGQFAWYIKARHTMQWGGLSDGFDWYEKMFGKSLELLQFFKSIDYPLSISTKGVWWAYDDRYRAALYPNVHLKVSIITADDEQATKVFEIGTPTPTERFALLKELHSLGVTTTLRMRPYIIGLTDKTVDTMVAWAKEAGCYSLSTEFLCLETRATNTMQERLNAMSAALGFDLFEFYKANSQRASGLLRLNYEIKRPYMQKLNELCDAAGVKLFVSDAHHKEKSFATCCCGIPPDKPTMCNYSKGHFMHALQIAKERGHVLWSDIAPFAEGLKNVPAHRAQGFNSNSNFRAKHAYKSFYDFMQDIWNNPKSWQSPARYFGGALVPCGLDHSGNIVYLYNAEFTRYDRGANPRNVKASADLSDTIAKERHSWPGVLHRSTPYPIFITSRGRAHSASTPNIIESIHQPYTLIVPSEEAVRYHEAFPRAQIVVQPPGSQLGSARLMALLRARMVNEPYMWLLDDDIAELSDLGFGDVFRDPFMVMMDIQSEVNRYSNIATAGILGEADEPGSAAFTVNPQQHMNHRFVLVRTNTGIDYNPLFGPRSDDAFAEAHARARWCNVTFNRYRYSLNKYASMGGGCQPFYMAGSQIDEAKHYQRIFGEPTPNSVPLQPKSLEVILRST